MWDALTMLLLLLPLGWWGRGWAGGPLMVGCVAAALLVVPWLTRLGLSPWWEWCAAGLGLMLGAALHGLRPKPTQPAGISSTGKDVFAQTLGGHGS